MDIRAFSELDRLVVSNFYENGQYGYAYQTVANNLEPGTAQHTWFSNAALINSGIGAASTFARVQTVGGYFVSGRQQAAAQSISDGIADAVLSSVLSDTCNRRSNTRPQ
jgi:hypothetical protein